MSDPIQSIGPKSHGEESCLNDDLPLLVEPEDVLPSVEPERGGCPNLLLAPAPASSKEGELGKVCVVD